MPKRNRLLALGPDNGPLWLRLYVQPVGDQWAAMLAGAEAPPPDAGTLTGLMVFGATLEQAEGKAKATPKRHTNA
jgi:hypothetical protein